jgi:uncharacterized iron-regulated membrane protein
MAFSGLTGGLMAFGPELTDYFSGGHKKVEAHGAPPLPQSNLQARVHAALPERRSSKITTYAGPSRPARPLGQSVERFIHWLHGVHQGHWGGPSSSSCMPCSARFRCCSCGRARTAARSRTAQ